MFFNLDKLHLYSNETHRDDSSSSFVEENHDLFWPLLVGIFVALALLWMICRHQCSAQEDSSHFVQCCPKSLGQKLRSICSITRKKTAFSPPEEPPNELLVSSSLQLREYPLTHPPSLCFVQSEEQSRRRSSSSWPMPNPQTDFYSHPNGFKLNHHFFHM